MDVNKSRCVLFFLVYRIRGHRGFPFLQLEKNILDLIILNYLRGWVGWVSSPL